MYAGHDRLLALADPSLHTNTSPSQCEMPPFLPLHGVFCAAAGEKRAAVKHTKRVEAILHASPLIKSCDMPRNSGRSR